MRLVVIALLTGCMHPTPTSVGHDGEPLPPPRAPASVAPVVLAEAAPRLPEAAWTKRLEPVRVHNANTEIVEPILLYGASGDVERASFETFCRVVAAKGAPPPDLNARLVQLVMKAAYHFESGEITIVSAFRPRRRGRGGKHSSGEAIDFKLRGVAARKLASYLRTLPRVGVGIYTNPSTQFVHLDVRDDSFHWLDASPPGKHWREKPLRDAGREARDASYTPASDLPEIAMR